MLVKYINVSTDQWAPDDLMLNEMEEQNHNFTLSDEINGPLLAGALAVQMVGALIANTVVLIATICQWKSLKLPSTLFFTSLVIAHLVMAVLFMPFYMISAATGEWIFGRTTQQKIATCSFVGYILCYSVIVIYMMLAAISFDRFLFIVKPHRYKQFMRPKAAVALIISIWVVAALLNSTPFFGLGRFGYTSYGCCVPEWENQSGYFIYIFLLSLMIVCVIIVTSVWTYCFTRKFIQEHSQLADSSVYVSRKRRLIGIFGAMFIAYVVCFAPGFIVGIPSQFFDVKAEAYATALSLFTTITIINPIIQSYFRPDINKAVIALYQKVKKWCAVNYANVEVGKSFSHTGTNYGAGND